MKILIIEDNPEMLAMLEQLLSEEGYQVWPCIKSSHFSRYLHEFQPDLIVLDLIMPDMDGLEILMELSKKHPTIKVICISGGSSKFSSQYLKTARYFGALECFKKPLEPRAFLSCIAELNGH